MFQHWLACHGQSVEINTFKEVVGVSQKRKKWKIKFILGISDMLCWSEKVLDDVVIKSLGVWKGVVT